MAMNPAIQRRRERRALEAKRDHLLVQKEKQRVELAKVRSELKATKPARKRTT